MTFDYDGACRDAATRQGLDPLTAALEAAEIEHGVAQTGGFCMVVTVPRPDGVWAVINDGAWELGFFRGDDWQTGEADAHVEMSLSSVEAAVLALRTSPVAV